MKLMFSPLFYSNVFIFVEKCKRQGNVFLLLSHSTIIRCIRHTHTLSLSFSFSLSCRCMCVCVFLFTVCIFLSLSVVYVSLCVVGVCFLLIYIYFMYVYSCVVGICMCCRKVGCAVDFVHVCVYLSIWHAVSFLVCIWACGGIDSWNKKKNICWEFIEKINRYTHGAWKCFNSSFWWMLVMRVIHPDNLIFIEYFPEY